MASQIKPNAHPGKVSGWQQLNRAVNEKENVMREVNNIIASLFTDAMLLAYGKPIPPNKPYVLNRKRSRLLARHPWLIIVDCPYCGRQHEHGWTAPDDINRVWTRKSHCWQGGEYHIVEKRGNHDG